MHNVLEHFILNPRVLIDAFLVDQQGRYIRATGDSAWSGGCNARTYHAEYGKRYARIVAERSSSSSVVCFIDLQNGDILKAASWKAPAPNGARGSLLSSDRGASCMGPYGCKSLR